MLFLYFVYEGEPLNAADRFALGKWGKWAKGRNGVKMDETAMTEMKAVLGLVKPSLVTDDLVDLAQFFTEPPEAPETS